VEQVMVDRIVCAVCTCWNSSMKRTDPGCSKPGSRRCHGHQEGDPKCFRLRIERGAAGRRRYGVEGHLPTQNRSVAQLLLERAPANAAAQLMWHRPFPARSRAPVEAARGPSLPSSTTGCRVETSGAFSASSAADSTLTVIFWPLALSEPPPTGAKVRHRTDEHTAPLRSQQVRREICRSPLLCRPSRPNISGTPSAGAGSVREDIGGDSPPGWRRRRQATP